MSYFVSGVCSVSRSTADGLCVCSFIARSPFTAACTNFSSFGGAANRHGAPGEVQSGAKPLDPALAKFTETGRTTTAMGPPKRTAGDGAFSPGHGREAQTGEVTPPEEFFNTYPAFLYMRAC